MKISDIIKREYPISTSKDAQTIEEIMASTGLTEYPVRRMIVKLKKRGTVSVVNVRRGNKMRLGYIIKK